MVVHPLNHWYGAVDKDKIDEILEALEEGEGVSKYLITE
jgi:(2Fe-2S) ferredoxin